MGRPPSQNITPKQELALVKLLAGGTDSEAGELAGVDRRTVFTWRHEDPAFASELRSRQQAIFERAMRCLVKDVENATKTVANLTEARDEAVRLRAAESIIDRVAAFLGNVPGGKERMVQALGVNVNVSANAQAVAALPAPDVSSSDRMAELAALFAQIPALAAPIVQVPNGSHQDIRAEVAVRPTGAESPQCEKNAL
jgi:hypothetical protein